jgi:hypothetical protein
MSSRITGSPRALRSPLLACLLFVAGYVLAGCLESSANYDFTQTTPIADRSSPHSKGQRPARLQWTPPEGDAGQVANLGSAAGSDNAAAVIAVSEWPSGPRVMAPPTPLDGPLFLSWRTRNPRDPPPA